MNVGQPHDVMSGKTEKEMSKDHPKLFISYSWSSPEHEQWVVVLATELMESGVNVILDKWDLKEGHDAYAFMEKMVTDSKINKVAIICDRTYSEKADGRNGGVGTETQIITPEIYNEQSQNKFVAVVVEKDERGKAYLPTYYKSRIYIDLSNQDSYATNFEQLLRWVFDKPLYVKPELGQKPAFLSDKEKISLGTTVAFRRALDAIRLNKDYASGAISEYFETFSKNLERFRISDKSGEIDDTIIENIEQFLPYRNELIEFFLTVSQYRATAEAMQQTHRLFETIIPYMYPPKDARSWSEWDYDNYKFIIHEMFLYCIASLLKYERYEFARYMLDQQFYVERNAELGRETMVSLKIFRHYLKSLDARNQRLDLRRLSVRSDLLEQRSKSSGIPFRYLMQADFVAFLKDSFDALAEGRRQDWWPETLLYVERYSGALEIFARSQSAEYLAKVGVIFNAKDKQAYSPLIVAFEDKTLYTPSWDYESISPKHLLGYDKLATRP